MVFKYAATTVLFTYLHTLSLHDPLPISAPLVHREPQGRHEPQGRLVRVGRRRPALERGAGDLRRHRAVELELGPGARPVLLAPLLPPTDSEVHTSELQSLMRISYAVFCLQNKNITNLTRLRTSAV